MSGAELVQFSLFLKETLSPNLTPVFQWHILFANASLSIQKANSSLENYLAVMLPQPSLD